MSESCQNIQTKSFIYSCLRYNFNSGFIITFLIFQLNNELRRNSFFILHFSELGIQFDVMGQKGKRMEAKKILMADDKKPMGELLRHKLLLQGFEVGTAKNEKEFSENALTHKSGLIVLDIWLRNKIGTEVYYRLLENGFDPEVPVIFITALVEGCPKDTIEGASGRKSAFTVNRSETGNKVRLALSGTISGIQVLFKGSVPSEGTMVGQKKKAA